MKEFKIIRQQHGLSLVEVLATTVILSIVILIIISILTNGQKHYSQQSEKNQELQQISYALKILTKEIRQHPNNIVVGTNSITIGGVHYVLDDTTLLRDSTALVSNVKEFQVNEMASTITILIISSSGEEFSTQIVKRT